MFCVLITPMIIILCFVPCPCFMGGSGRGLKKQSTCAFEQTVPPLIGMEVTVQNNLLNVRLRGGGEGRGNSSTLELRVPPLIGMELIQTLTCMGQPSKCVTQGVGGEDISWVKPGLQVIRRP